MWIILFEFLGEVKGQGGKSSNNPDFGQILFYILCPSVFSDYLFAKDRIFAHLNLSGNELSMYERLYEIMVKSIPRPDLIVYLQASTEVLMKRIALRDRPFERKMSFEYMRRLNLAYEEFFSYPDNYKKIKLIKINTNGLDFVGKSKDLEYVIDEIYKGDSLK
ncbi:unnamed protein product [marine sediment metagenome]|uniref:Deoxynucleoside kinase domain-containing protein n=1 Tax=marine sediment metagenome TaxID=412755 RepID=X1GVF5_9ZZZZ